MHLASKMFAFGGLFLAAAACGGGSTTGGTGNSGGGSTTSGSSGPSAMQACADQAHAVCSKRDACSPNSFLNNRTYGGEMACEMLIAGPCVSALMANGTAQTPAKIENCLQAYPGYMCTDFFDNNPPAACIPPSGTLATGAACGASAQCTTGYCSIPQYQVCGTCAALPVAGDNCTVTADCGRNLQCVTPTGATMGKCAAFVASGGACLTNVAPCEVGLACVGDDEATMTMGTCKAQVTTAGGACDLDRKTMANCFFDGGLYCIPTAKGSGVGTCQAVTVVDAGMACGPVGAMPITGFADCHAGATCIKPTGSAVGTCTAPAANGAACDNDTTKGPPCLAPARCVPGSSTSTAGTCTVPDATMCH